MNYVNKVIISGKIVHKYIINHNRVTLRTNSTMKNKQKLIQILTVLL